MSDLIVIGGLILAIAVAVVAKARQSLRQDAETSRGLAPGTGDHIIHVEYSSGVGGGHATQIRVPKDPQAYARRFVPLGQRPEETTVAGPAEESLAVSRSEDHRHSPSAADSKDD